MFRRVNWGHSGRWRSLTYPVGADLDDPPIELLRLQLRLSLREFTRIHGNLDCGAEQVGGGSFPSTMKLLIDVSLTLISFPPSLLNLTTL